MPKTKSVESVLHDWVHTLLFQQQALLLTGMRGPDQNSKHNNAKCIIRYLRGAVIKPAGNWSGLNDNSFMWGEYDNGDKFVIGKNKTGTLFEMYAKEFWDDHDQYPHHFIMHLIHCAEVVGYKHPDADVARYWRHFYFDACEALHMRAESAEEMDGRLNDWGCGI